MVEEAVEGGYTARALGTSILGEADTSPASSFIVTDTAEEYEG